MKYVIVSGKGRSSRQNVEALLDDYYYMSKKQMAVVIAIEDAASEAQLFAAQYAVDKSIDVIIYSKPGSNLFGLPKSSLYESDAPIDGAAQALKKSDSEMWILWSDEDMDSAKALNASKNSGLVAKDLCNGLVVLEPGEDIQLSPEVKFPKIEELFPSLVNTPDDTEDEDDDEDDDEPVSDSDVLMEAVQVIADVIAEAVGDRIKQVIEEVLAGLKAD